MIETLVSLLIVLIVAGLIWYIISLIPLPPPFKVIAQVVCGLILLLWLLNILGLFGVGWRVHWR